MQAGRTARSLAFVVSASLLLSCGSGGPEIPPELLETGDSPAAGYPSGPYGVEVGSVVEDFSFQGYQRPDLARSLEEIRFADFYDPDGAKGVHLLLINTAAAWCQPCQIEHGDLPDRVNEFRSQGLVVLSLLFQDPAGDPATVETLDAWTQTFDTNFPMALDPSYQMGRYGAAETPPLNLLVDLQNMRVIALFIGNQDGPLWDLVEKELAERRKE